MSSNFNSSFPDIRKLGMTAKLVHTSSKLSLYLHLQTKMIKKKKLAWQLGNAPKLNIMCLHLPLLFKNYHICAQDAMQCPFFDGKILP